MSKEKYAWSQVTQATHQKPLRHTIDYRADQFTLSRFEIHSNTCHERKPGKASANIIGSLSNDNGDLNENVISKYKFALF